MIKQQKNKNKRIFNLFSRIKKGFKLNQKNISRNRRDFVFKRFNIKLDFF